jgi:hypothetical protein
MTVTLSYDPLWRAVDWAREHCPSYITNLHSKKAGGLVPDLDHIDYFFGNEADAIMFILRWS